MTRATTADGEDSEEEEQDRSGHGVILAHRGSVMLDNLRARFAPEPGQTGIIVFPAGV